MKLSAVFISAAQRRGSDRSFGFINPGKSILWLLPKVQSIQRGHRRCVCVHVCVFVRACVRVRVSTVTCECVLISCENCDVSG